MKKVCSYCGEAKPLVEFWKENSHRPDGLQRNCKACNYFLYRQWRKQNSSDYLKVWRRWWDSHPFRVKLYRERHRQKRLLLAND